MRKKYKEKNYWDEYENNNLEPISEKSKSNWLSHDLPNTMKDEKEEERIKNKRKKEGICKNLVDNERNRL